MAGLVDLLAHPRVIETKIKFDQILFESIRMFKV